MQLLLDALGIELQLFCWVILGSLVGLVVELNTGDNEESSVFFQTKLARGSRFVWFSVCAVNVLVGALFAYAITPFVIEYLNVEVPFKQTMTGFLVGVAGLSLVRGYAATWRNRKNVAGMVFKIIDLMRNMK